MLYMEFINKAKELTIEQHENGMWYLQPEWKYILYSNDLAVLKFRDFRPDWYTVEDELKLEVEKRNSKDSKLNAVLEWVSGVVNTAIDPAMLEEENALVSDAISWMKMSHESQKQEVAEKISTEE